MSPPPPSAIQDFERDVSRARINFVWLWKLRWAAVIGQLATVVIVSGLMEVWLPDRALVAVITLTAASNLVFGAVFRRALEAGRLDRFGEDGEWLSGLVTVADMLFLTALLYTTGGWKNPFAIFYFVHLVLAAVILPTRWAWSLTAVAASCYAFLSLWSRPLPVFEDPSQRSIQILGMATAFTLAALIVVYFVTRVGGELENRERELERARQKRARLERVEALVTLSAGAAHELSTPLSTIAVVARELEHEIEKAELDPAGLEDVRLIRQEVSRCRAILEQMSESSGNMVGAGMQRIRVDQLLREAIEPLRAGDRLRVQLDEAAADSEVEAPVEALRRALRGLVKNGLDASEGQDSPVVVLGRRAQGRVHLEVVDRGTGMEEAVLTRAEDPFFTTKEPGRGMGLGLFLARSVIERLEGRLSIRSRPGVGTRVEVVLPATS